MKDAPLTSAIPTLSALRAVDDLRRQIGFNVQDTGSIKSYLPIEFINEYNALAGAHVLLSGSRARYLKLTDKAGDAFSFPAQGLSIDALRFLTDPLAKNMPIHVDTISPADKTDALALRLVKQASLLPALLISDTPLEGAQTISAKELAAHIETPHIELMETASAALPIEGAEHARMLSYRVKHGSETHLALIIGELSDDPLVRVHSSCVTGDILGSLRCDCGSQLKLALNQISAEGSGVLLYLHQEGRGIGLTNKLRAYALQEQGVDTYEANLMLGFDEDERDFAAASGILSQLGVKRCRLLTNNPQKIEQLKSHGVDITARVPLAIAPGRHNHAYLEAKGKKAGHLFN